MHNRYAKKKNLKLIFVEMPINYSSMIYTGINGQIESYIRQHNVSYLSIDGIPPLPATAYSDQFHLQVSGSMLFSQWLGMQLGKAEIEGSLLDVNSLVWSPVSDTWPKSTYLSTLGLTQSSYNEYMLSLSKFDLLPQNSVMFNPSKEEKFDKQFLQSLIGFDIEFKNGITSQDRENIFQFMAVLGKMRYQDDLQLSQVQDIRLEQWRTTLDPTILTDLGAQYVLCRVELAKPNRKHCPIGIENDPNYLLVTTWNFDPLYEKYYLYKVVGSN